jgi:putative hydrolase of the HAD superfamily
MDKLTPRVIIFDLGSTLIEYESIPWDELGIHRAESARQFLIRGADDVPDAEAFHDAFARIRAGYRQLAADSLVERDVLMVAARLLEKLKIPNNQELVDGFFDAYYEPVAKRLYVYDDTLRTLSRLRPSYPVMGLISNTVFPERSHRKELKRFGIEQYLDFAVFSSTFKLRKPHPDIFYHAANLAGVGPRECLYIGDRYEEDIQGPRQVGMEAILKVKPDREYPPDMPESVRRIDTLEELLDHVEL